MNDYTKTQTYFYDLPEELIAQHPLDKRDTSRMLVYNKNKDEIKHKHFYDIVDYFKKGDVLVLNNSRVLPARIFGIKEETGAKIEVLLQKRIDLNNWEIIAKPTKRLNVGTKIKFNDELSGEISLIGDYGCCTINFIYKGRFEEILDRIGTMPLPPYIHEKLTDKERYQTVYSKIEGSSAAPTAGLHFTPEILEKIKDKGIIVVEVLLHVGLGTFRPVKEENILQHKMHSEYISVSPEVAEIVTKAKKEGRRVVACGTTSMRTLESMAQKSEQIAGLMQISCDKLPQSCTDGVHSSRQFSASCPPESRSLSTQDTKLVNFNGYKLISGQKDTDIFIYPPYKFKIVDVLITNFHLPESTLLMLVSAFIGLENMKKVYKEAIKEKYRFFSFGDCCLFI
ncbi:MAG: tRNA preQ1(34) S-adenosylmethionine ribosyltransferase-isomerase QueA [Clostridia bacterium]|nr:tRNA preQ1(34) S-adenosylmethionine ribosyltransferase-isomerase QueA [Clostridia bacterium]